MRTLFVDACHVHPKSRAAATCTRCYRFLCDACTSYVDSDPSCASCARRARRSRFALRVSGAVATLATISGALAFLGLGGRALAQTGDEKVTTTPQERALEDALAKEPCDRSKALELVEARYQGGEYRAAIDRSNAFVARCGDYPRLRWITYEAHSRLSEWGPAADEASKLIESDPNDKDYWAWRGLALEKKGDVAKAASDYEQVLAIEPRVSSVPINLANLYEKMNRPCDAIAPLEQLVSLHEDAMNAAQIRARIERLYTRPECAERAGAGRAVITFTPRADVIHTTVSVNGVPMRMIVDTGASRVSLSTSAARRLGLHFEGWRTVLVRTAGGVRVAHAGTVDEVAVQRLRAKHVAVLVMDGLEGEEGLLGQSFLARFAIRMEAGQGRMELLGRAADK